MKYKLYTKTAGVGVDPKVYIMMSIWSNAL